MSPPSAPPALRRLAAALASPPGLAALAVVAATLAFHARGLAGSFVAWDDAITIYDNPRLGPWSWETVTWALTDTATTMRWMPLSLLSLVVTYTLHGLDPFGFHLGNWLLHGVSALAVFLGLRELLGRGAGRDGGRDDPWVAVSAAAGALAWSLHPLRVEVVAWSNSRGHALAGCFVFLSLLAYLRAHRADAPPAPAWRRLGPAAALFLAALLSHPVAIGAAPLFPLLDLHQGRLGGAAGWWTPAARRVLLEKLPFAAVAAFVLVVSLLIRTYASGRWPAPVPLDEFGILPRAVQAAYAWIHYAQVTLWPVGLQPAPTELIDFDPWTAPYLARVAVLLGVTGALLLLRRRWPAAWLLWLAHLAVLIPALGLTEHPMFACDRYTYQAGLVLAAAVAGAVAWLGRAANRRRAVAAAAAGLLAVSGGLTWRQTGIWEDSVALFEHMLPLIGDHPYRVNILIFLGFAYRAAGRPLEAIPLLEEGSAQRPLDPALRGVTGEVLIQAGRPVEAIPHLQMAIQFDQVSVDLRCRLALSLAVAGRRAEATTQLRFARGIQPDAPCVKLLMQRLPLD